MRVDMNAGAAGMSGALASQGASFQQAMRAESGRSGGGNMSSASAGMTGGTGSSMMMKTGTARGSMMQEGMAVGGMAAGSGGGCSSGGMNAGGGGCSSGGMSAGGGGCSRGGSINTAGGIESVGGSGGNLGGVQGPSERIPDPTEHVREVQLGDKTITVGGDGSASEAEVNAAAAELERMYETSPTFRNSIDSGPDSMTFTLGKRDDNTSWGGGGRVFININNVQPGNNDTFQGLVGHEFAHAADGLGHGAELDSIEERVRAEA